MHVNAASAHGDVAYHRKRLYNPAGTVRRLHARSAPAAWICGSE
jgi:hypothetical protein